MQNISENECIKLIDLYSTILYALNVKHHTIIIIIIISLQIWDKAVNL